MTHDERMEMQTIAERDAAQDALTAMYQAVCGRSPEWSNFYDYQDAINDVKYEINQLRASTEKESQDERR